VEGRGERPGDHLEPRAAARRIVELDIERVQVARDLAQRPGPVVVAALGRHRPVGQRSGPAGDARTLRPRRRHRAAGGPAGDRRLDRAAVAGDLIVEPVERFTHRLVSIDVRGGMPAVCGRGGCRRGECLASRR